MKYVINSQQRGKSSYVKAGLKTVTVGTVMHVSSHMESTNSFVTNQHSEKKFVGISINTSTVSSAQGATLFIRSSSLMKSLRISAIRK